MLKRMFHFIMLIFLPIYCFGYDDVCTKPEKFTVDKRCYVTDEQKQQDPFNAVVALVDNYGRPYCTGTIIKGKDGKPYLYTAKHCTDKNEDKISDDTLTIQLQDGRRINVKKNNVGSYDIEHDKIYNGDWAVYSMDTQDVPMVEKTGKHSSLLPTPFEFIRYDARVVGYGSLKIMSDAEIALLKEKYIDYLYENKKQWKENSVYGFVPGGIDAGNAYVKNFIDGLDYDYWKELFYDVFLKISYCKYTSFSNLPIGCQGWGGNSGGPIFDNDGKIMGIFTRGASEIGGKYHAGSENFWTSSLDSSVSLLK